MLAELNSRHAIPNHVSFAEGAGGLPVAAVNNPLATAEIHLHGAHVTAFQPCDQRPVLWMSRDAIFSPPKPIRGGIPICWPWFGTPADHPGRTQHGFARNRPWTVRATRVTEAGETEIIFGLKDDAESLAQWPHAFDLSYTVIIGTTLTIALTFANLSDTPAEVGAALHTYFAVGDVEKIRISGLADRQYHDQLAGSRAATS
jgi:D-hexose-6-phosphate mutarotase